SGLRTDTHHHPSFISGSGFAGRLLSSVSRKGVRNDWTFHRARGAMYRSTWPRVLSAHGKTKASEAAQRPRSAREWTLRLAPCPRGVTYADVTPFGRAVARTCTWTVRPCCRRLSPPAPFKGSTDPQAC